MQREYPEHPIVGVGAVILHEGRALLVRRGRAPLEGAWSVPGGALELGETLRAGAEREALEETGLRVQAGEVVEVFDSIFRAPAEDGSDKKAAAAVAGQAAAVASAPSAPEYHYVIIDFLCRVIGGELRAASDAAEARWFTREELADLDLSIAMQRALDKAFEMAEAGASSSSGI
jgi:8-oxo-dGTP diphosphatase